MAPTQARHAQPSSPFLTARWLDLVMLNYDIDPALLEPRVPAGTELDLFDGRAIVSLVAFRFENTRVKGLAIPGHSNFEEVNLRFYVKRVTEEGAARGVVFIKEIVPLRAVAVVANVLFGEPYAAMPMDHTVSGNGSSPRHVSYGWRHGGEWDRVAVEVDPARPDPTDPPPGSEAEFITEHYWGFTQRRTGTVAYRVEHPRWRTWQVSTVHLKCRGEELYGAVGAALEEPPASAFLAEGSDVVVYWGRRL